MNGCLNQYFEDSKTKLIQCTSERVKNELYMNVPISYLKRIVSNKITYFELILYVDIKLNIYHRYCLNIYFSWSKLVNQCFVELLYRMTKI